MPKGNIATPPNVLVTHMLLPLPTEWINYSGASRHMIGTQYAHLTFKQYLSDERIHQTTCTKMEGQKRERTYIF